MVVNRRINKKEEFITNLLKNVMNKRTYTKFLIYLDNKNYRLAFILFIDNLKLIINLDGHVSPQSLILKTYNIDLNDINYFINIDNKNEMDKLNRIITIPKQTGGGTKKSILRLLLYDYVMKNKELLRKIQQIYKQDKELFKHITKNKQEI